MLNSLFESLQPLHILNLHLFLRHWHNCWKSDVSPLQLPSLALFLKILTFTMLFDLNKSDVKNYWCQKCVISHVMTIMIHDTLTHHNTLQVTPSYKTNNISFTWASKVGDGGCIPPVGNSRGMSCQKISFFALFLFKSSEKCFSYLCLFLFKNLRFSK